MKLMNINIHVTKKVVCTLRNEDRKKVEYNNGHDYTTQSKLVIAVHDPIMKAKHVRNNFSRVSRC